MNQLRVTFHESSRWWTWHASIPHFSQSGFCFSFQSRIPYLPRHAAFAYHGSAGGLTVRAAVFLWSSQKFPVVAMLGQRGSAQKFTTHRAVLYLPKVSLFEPDRSGCSLSRCHLP